MIIDDEMPRVLPTPERKAFWCYLYDYGDERRFYAILKEKGDSIDQYDLPNASESEVSLPEPLWSVLPETAVPVRDLRAFEERDEVVHVIILLSLETGFRCRLRAVHDSTRRCRVRP